jgi:hypothetical protein
MIMKDKKDSLTSDLFGRTNPVGRPVKYHTDEERKAARAKAERLRRKKRRDEGYKEIRMFIKKP